MKEVLDQGAKTKLVSTDMKIGPLARKHSESLRSYHKRQAKERKAIDLHLKGKLSFEWQGILQTNGRVVRKPYRVLDKSS